jgi:hypothetical protein
MDVIGIQHQCITHMGIGITGHTRRTFSEHLMHILSYFFRVQSYFSECRSGFYGKGNNVFLKANILLIRPKHPFSHFIFFFFLRSRT